MDINIANLYSSLPISDEYKIIIDVKISSNGKTEWVSVEVLQATELMCAIFQKNYVLFTWQDLEWACPKNNRCIS